MEKASEIYYKCCPNGFYINRDEVDNIQLYLEEIDFFLINEYVRKVETAGEGNMNLVQRVYTNKRSFILKQSRPWVEKFPQINAPAERSIIEGQFYSLVKIKKDLSKFFPDLYFKDEASGILILEDLGEASDYLDIYNLEVDIEKTDVLDLLKILSLLHESLNVNTTSERIYNRSMRALNAEHIFNFPFRKDNKFDLDEIEYGLQKHADKLKEDNSLLDKIQRLKEIYLDDGDYLLSGDFYPGSWLNTEDGVKIIDPEFCFFGPAEFDLGIFKAHLILADQEKYLELITQFYFGKNNPNTKLIDAFAGIEILRRILGLAQLPLTHNLNKRVSLINSALILIDSFK